MGTENVTLKWYETTENTHQYDHYYDPDFTVGGVPPAYDSAYSASAPAGYDDQSGKHPFSYVRETGFSGVNEHKKDRVLTDIEAIRAEIRAEQQAYGKAYAGQFGKHLFFDRNWYGSTFTFLGYGELGYKDFVLYELSTSYDLTYRIHFDQLVRHGALNGFGILTNTRIDEAGKLDGYLTYLHFDKTARSGELHVVKLDGIDAKKLCNAGRDGAIPLRGMDAGYDSNMIVKMLDASTKICNFTLNPGEWIDAMTCLSKDYLDSWFKVFAKEDSSVQTCLREFGVRDKRISDASRYSFGLLADYAEHSCNELTVLRVTGLRDRRYNNTVYFDKNGGDTDAQPASRESYGYGGTCMLPNVNPTKAGYIFRGWNTKPDGTGEIFTAQTPVYTTTAVYAQWREIFPGVIFKAGPNGRLVGANVLPDGTVRYPDLAAGSPLPAPPATRADTGFVFETWMAENGQKADFSADKISEYGTTVTAAFRKAGTGAELEKYIVTIVASTGGQLSGKTEFFVMENPITGWECLGNAVGGFSMPTATVFAGYKFDGWQDVDGSFIDVGSIKDLAIYGDTTITAAFSRVLPPPGSGPNGEYVIDFVVPDNFSVIASGGTLYIPWGVKIGTPPVTITHLNYEVKYYTDRDTGRSETPGYLANIMPRKDMIFDVTIGPCRR